MILYGKKSPADCFSRIFFSKNIVSMFLFVFASKETHEIQLYYHIPDPGVLKFAFGRDVPPWNFKVDLTNTKFSRKSDQSDQFCTKFSAKSPNFFKIFLNLTKFWLKFQKFLKNRPIHIPNFAFYAGSFIHQEAEFVTHVGSTSPRVFCTECPPPIPDAQNMFVCLHSFGNVAIVLFFNTCVMCVPLEITHLNLETWWKQC